MKNIAQANLENLYRIFTVPEAPDSKLGSIDHAISDNVAGFLQEHIVALEREIEEIEGEFPVPAFLNSPLSCPNIQNSSKRNW